MLRKTGIVLVAFTTGIAFGQKSLTVQSYMDGIKAEELKKHLVVLASDAYEGRETGKKGQKMAAEYLVKAFKEMGCSTAPGMTGYEQYYDVIETKPGGDLVLNSKALKFKSDFVYLSAKSKLQLDKVNLYTKEELALTNPEQAVLVHTVKSMDVRTEMATLRKGLSKSVKAIVLLTQDYDTLFKYMGHYATGASMRLADEVQKSNEVPVFLVRASSMDGAFDKAHKYLIGKGKQKEAKKDKTAGTFSCLINNDEQRLTSSNVLAYIPGSDPVLSKEVVVITAHYDHIGIENGVVFNGADDDGTGTVALLELAQAFMEAKNNGKGPKRSLLIMPVSGEEKGLLGSAYYASHPVLPLAETIADLNIDMIGRDDIAHAKESNYIYVIGSNMLSDDLHNANEQANRDYTQLNLDYRFNSKTDPNQFYYRSDHYNFAKNGIPSVFYFSGVHEDYHQSTDDVEKINFDKAEKVARLVFATAWNLADAKNRPVVKQ